jgi:hypothetical protein
MRGPHGTQDLYVDPPLLVIMEAKKGTTVEKTESQTELFGQLRVLMAKECVQTSIFC